MVSLEYEKSLGGCVIGIDEAGRGPLAGGVFAAAVTVPLARAEELLAGDWSGINDSKKLTAHARERLADVIKSTKECVWAVAQATREEIDEINILNATFRAMARAASAVANQLGDGECPTLLVDGNPARNLPFPSRNLVKGDAKSLFVAAASILAKTARDEDCLRLERLYPGYGFAQHKGYPTARHLALLARLGPCPEHRRSFGPVAQRGLWDDVSSNVRQNML